MHLHSPHLRRPHGNVSLHVAALLLTFHYVFVVYVSSAYLGEFFSDRIVGFIYAAGSLLTIATFAAAPFLLARIGTRALTLVGIVIEGVALVGLALDGSPALVALLFAAHVVLAPLLSYCLDIFLEERSKDKDTGRTRAMFLLMSSLTFVISPVIIGFVLQAGGFPAIYLISAAFLIPLYFLIAAKFPVCRVAVKPFFLVARQFLRNRDLRNIFFSNFTLQFFFAWMTIYTPLYLASHAGFSWAQIGIMFSIMLTPFVLLELPLGYLADKFIGEKEILIGGFILMAVTTALLAFIPTTFLMWTTMLFLTRIGAAAIEIMTETYFFKHVSANDAEEIGFFRMTRPFAYLTAPLVAAASLFFVSKTGNGFSYTFILLALLVLLGAIPSFLIKDTK